MHEPYEDDPDYHAYLANCAEACSCCPECSIESPCSGVLAGGFCDLVRCRCNDEPNDFDDDFDDEELTT